MDQVQRALPANGNQMMPGLPKDYKQQEAQGTRGYLKEVCCLIDTEFKSKSIIN